MNSLNTAPSGASRATLMEGLTELQLQALRGQPLVSSPALNTQLITGQLPAEDEINRVIVSLPEWATDALKHFQEHPGQGRAADLLGCAQKLSNGMDNEDFRLISSTMALGPLSRMPLRPVLITGCLMRALASSDWDSLSRKDQQRTWTYPLRSAIPRHFGTQPDPELALHRALTVEGADHLRELYLEGLSTQPPEHWPEEHFIQMLMTLTRQSGARPTTYPWARSHTLACTGEWGPQFIRELLTCQRQTDGPEPRPLTLPDLNSQRALWGRQPITEGWNRQKLTLLIMATDAWGMKEPTRTEGLLAGSLKHISHHAQNLSTELHRLMAEVRQDDPLMELLRDTEAQLTPHLSSAPQ